MMIFLKIIFLYTGFSNNETIRFYQQANIEWMGLNMGCRFLLNLSLAIFAALTAALTLLRLKFRA